MRPWSTPVPVLTLLTVLAAPVGSANAAPSRAPWTGAWAAAVQPPLGETFAGPNWSEEGFADQSLRQVVRVSTGGTRLRIRLSNLYGETPLRVAGASVGKAGPQATVRPGTLRPLRFAGSTSAVIAPGRETASDAIALPTAPLDRLSVTLYLARPTGPATFHAFAVTPSYRATGDHRSASGGGAFAQADPTASWYYLTGVDVAGGRRRGAVVAFGDSITDGVSSSFDADDRYPDQLAERLAAAGRPAGVLNTGIAGSRVLHGSRCHGEASAARFTRDALARPGVRTVVVLSGVNDIIDTPCDRDGAAPSPPVTAEQLIDGHRALIRAARGRGIAIVGATLTPFQAAAQHSAEREAVRAAVNRWIRAGGEYDAVADLDRALAQPGDEGRLAAAYDAGDGLHPNDAGLQLIADTVADALKTAER
ncbi:SGNH/GDSL hydrolase family protein [Spirillospora sp. NPDC127200]